MAGLRIDHCDWAGGREAMLRFGPVDGPTVIAALPLFEEANRTRASLIGVLRRLADRGIASALPDLPGTGESLVATEDALLSDWRAAFAAAARTLPRPIHAIAWRGGALVDAEAEVVSRWHLSPVSGPDTVRELRRVQAVSDGSLFAGNRVSGRMIDELETDRLSVMGPVRSVRLNADPRDADTKLPGRPLWRAAEPGIDPVLEAALAEDIVGWVARCDG